MPLEPSIATDRVEHRYLKILDLQRLRHLVFSSRRGVEGQDSGRHASPQRGHSVEFNDYRQYAPGDEIGKIDWKVYGRSDKLFIKRFEHHTDLTVNLLIDSSASMSYSGMAEGPPPSADTPTPSWLDQVSLTKQKTNRRKPSPVLERPSKYDQACLMAAAIAFLIIKQQDQVTFGIAQQGLKHFQPPVGTLGQLKHILDTMEYNPPSGEAHLPQTLRDLAQRTSRKGPVVLFSDLLEDQGQILRALSTFTHRGNEVIVFQTLHADELRLPDLGDAIFVDSESEQRLRLNVDDVVPAYEQRLKAFLRSWKTAFAARGIDHNVVSTAVSYHKALERYLFSRAT